MKQWLYAGALILSIGVMGGCSSNYQTVQIEIQNMAFTKQEINLKTGVPVELVLVNKDEITHDLSVDTIPITVGTEALAEEEHQHGDQKVPDLHVSAQPGKQGMLVFTPNEAGIYTFYCTVPGHKAMGMEGKLVVSD